MNEQTFTNIFKMGRALGRVHEQKSWEKMFYDSPELLFTVSGNGFISYQDKSDRLSSGDLVVYNSLPRHQFKRENEWFYYWVHIPPELMEPYAALPYNCSVPGVRKIHFPEKEAMKLSMEFKELLQLYSRKKYGWQEICENLLRLILTRAFVRMKQELPQPTEISQISSRLDSFLPGKNMEELARECGLSRAAFFMNFRKQFGCSPLTYRNNILLTRAKAFLRTTDLKIKEISDILNFQSPYYFASFFMKHVHLSPTEYREKMSSKESER